jgi:hypothetical protein
LFNLRIHNFLGITRAKNVVLQRKYENTYKTGEYEKAHDSEGNTERWREGSGNDIEKAVWHTCYLATNMQLTV